MTQTKDVITKRMAQKTHSHLEAVPDEEFVAIPTSPNAIKKSDIAVPKPLKKKKTSGKSKKKN